MMAPIPLRPRSTRAMPSIDDYRGIVPAIACPFTADHRIDEPALRRAGFVARRPRRRRRGDDERPHGRGLLAFAVRTRDGHAHRRRRAARPLAGHLVDRLRRPRRCRRPCARGRRRRCGGARRDAASPLAALRLHAGSRAQVLRRDPPGRASASTSSATSIRHGRERRIRRNCWPTSLACPMSRRSRSDSAT